MDKKIDQSRSWPKGYEPKEESGEDLSTRLGLLETILKAKPEKKALVSEIYRCVCLGDSASSEHADIAPATGF